MPLSRPVRRLLAPVFVAVEIALLVGFAVTALVGLVLAPFDGRRRLLRIGAMGVAYLAVELSALVALWGAWLIRRRRPEAWWEDTTSGLLAWALGAILGSARRCLGFVVVVDGPPDRSPPGPGGPVLVLARHGGPGDSVALVWLLLSRYGRTPRVVLKEMLQWEPLLDVALNRMGACFLPARPPQGAGQAARLGEMAAGLGPRDALLLFPEGGNWTPHRRVRAIQRLRSDRKYQAARAATLMEHVLPPRPAGVLACLDARPDMPVVVFAHTGLDTLTTAGQIWRAIPFAVAMTVRWWPAPPAPAGDEARLDWLTSEWAVVDEWIDAHKARTGD